jgi:hypothetical protein
MLDTGADVAERLLVEHCGVVEEKHERAEHRCGGA